MHKRDSNLKVVCGLYIDVENLQNDAQRFMDHILAEWPSEREL